MDIEYNFLNKYEVNRKCVYKGIFIKQCLIHEVKFTMFDSIYIFNTQQKTRKIMYFHLSDVQRIIKKWQIPDSYDAHYKQHYKSTTSRINFHNFIAFRVL